MKRCSETTLRFSNESMRCALRWLPVFFSCRRQCWVRGLDQGFLVRALYCRTGLLSCAPLCKKHEHKNSHYADPNSDRFHPSHLSTQWIKNLTHGLVPPRYEPTRVPTDSNQQEHPNFSKSMLQVRTDFASIASSKTNASNLWEGERAWMCNIIQENKGIGNCSLKPY